MQHDQLPEFSGNETVLKTSDCDIQQADNLLRYTRKEYHLKEFVTFLLLDAFLSSLFCRRFHLGTTGETFFFNDHHPNYPP